MDNPRESIAKSGKTESPWQGPHPDEHRDPWPAEPATLRYLRLLWHHKFLIVLGSLLPVVVVGVLLYLWPQKYTTTFVYEYPATETAYEVLLGRFYSSENLRKIIGRLRDGGAGGFASELDRARTNRALEKLIQFETLPPHPKRVPTTDPAISERIITFEPQLLCIEITGDSKQDVSVVSAVVADNFENVLPVYDAKSSLVQSIRELRSLAAEIEDNRFRLALDLQEERMRLEDLSKAQTDSSEVPQGDVAVEITDVQKNLELLPLVHQIRAARSKIIDLRETADSEQRKYDYYLAVLDFDRSALAKIDESILAYYTIQQFVAFLDERLNETGDAVLADHIRSCIRRTENLASAGRRVGQRPVIYPVSKHIAVHSVLTLIVSLMVMTFAAVVLDMRDEMRRGQHAGPAAPTPDA